MLVACRLAGLSALETDYAGSERARNARRTRARAMRGPSESLSDVHPQASPIGGPAGRVAALHPARGFFESACARAGR